ncbi:MAG: hypothetical protein RI903_1400, partial [Bacteroidota bacterium]
MAHKRPLLRRFFKNNNKINPVNE